MARHRLLFATLCGSAFIIAIAACVGDDPSPATPAGGPDATPGPDGTTTDAPSTTDAAEADAPRCRDEDPFEPPVELANLASNTPIHVRLTADETEIYFQNATVNRVMVATRANANAAFGTPQFVDTSAIDGGAVSADPTISADGLTLVFHVGGHLAKMTRLDRQSPLGSAQLIGLDDPNQREEDSHLLGDKRALYFTRHFTTDGGSPNTVWRSASGPSGFDAPTQVAIGIDPDNPSPSDDELTIYWSERTASRIRRATRASTATTFGPATPVPELDIADLDAGGSDRPGWLSPDKCRMYLVSGKGGLTKAYVASRKPR